MSGSKSPLQVAADVLNAPAIKIVITLGASTAMLGVLLSQILGISRMMFAMGRRNDLPPMFEKVHRKFKVPDLGIIVTGIIILILTIAGSFGFIVRAASFTILIYYSITNIAALKQPEPEQRFGKIIASLGLIGCLVMSVSLRVDVILIGVGLLFAGFIVRWIFQKI